ncbi:hypothetical protein SASPL_149510 [Salvia splendens]|uniref:Uncharacterized protein n=1 Tax=Salvia splendens TaxID=180675 RepID=A0A8X8Z4Q9_SALSN|nr:hypothetical protein SASPL_149510 [Salvia splendens]
MFDFIMDYYKCYLCITHSIRTCVMCLIISNIVIFEEELIHPNHSLENGSPNFTYKCEDCDLEMHPQCLVLRLKANTRAIHLNQSEQCIICNKALLLFLSPNHHISAQAEGDRSVEGDGLAVAAKHRADGPRVGAECKAYMPSANQAGRGMEWVVPKRRAATLAVGPSKSGVGFEPVVAVEATQTTADGVEIKSKHKSHPPHPPVAHCRDILSRCDECGERHDGFFFSYQQ